MIPVEEFERVGLIGPDTPPDRLELLRWIESRGHTIEHMIDGASTGNLSSVAGDRRMVPGDRLTRAEAIERCGLEPDVFDAFATAFGFVPVAGAPPGEVGYTVDEIEVFELLGVLSSMFSPDEGLSFVRVLGSSLGRLGEAVVSMFLADVESPHIESGDGELALARKVYDGVGLLDGLTARLDPILRRNVLQAVERSRRASLGDERLKYRFAVGFVDLVGFTERSEQMSTAELASFVRDFEGTAHDIAVENGARVVKLIGDEVMFVATDSNDACRTAAALTTAFTAGDGVVVPRGGLALGDVLMRGGDYYGSVVNLASRLVDQAVPEEVLVTEAVVQDATACRFEPAGRRMMKGFDAPVPTWSLVAT